MKKYLFILFVLCYDMAAAMPSRPGKEAPNITVRSFKVTYPAAGRVRLEMRAAGEGGITVGSYIVKVSDVLPGRSFMPLPGFEMVNAVPHIVTADFKTEKGAMLKDNGAKDEDARTGVFATTFSTKGWPVGRYFITMYALNRPAPGPYYVASRIISVDVGKPDLRGMGMQPNVPGARHTVIWQKDDVYACFPSLLKLGDGRLVTSFGTKIRSSHIDPTGGSRTMVSADNGRSWKETTEKFNVQYRSAAADGRLVNAGAGGWRYVPDSARARLQNEGRTIMESTPGTIAWLNNEAWFNTSHDAGKTWVKQSIPIPDDVAGLMTFSSIQTKKGLRLVSVYGPRKNAPAGSNNSEVYFLRSADDGKTWEFVYLTPGKMKQPSVGPNESTLIELPNGEILCMLRTSDVTNLYSSISKDGGKTWSYPENTGIWGYPPSLTILPNGAVLCIYGYRRPPMGIRACISYDNGRTWDVENELVLRSDGLAAGVGDLGYPKITQLPNGELFTIYYIATNGAMPYIAGTHFRVPAEK